MPVFRHLAQNTPDWLAWRRGGIGASDAPVIMGVSPWTDLETLWIEKTGQGTPGRQNSAMRRGVALEPVARAAYEGRHGVRMAPACLEHDTHGWMRASLDGLSPDGGIVLEIKCPGARDHDAALAGEVPEHYVPQLQHLLMVSGARACHYWSWRGGAGAKVEVAPDPAYLRELLARERDFWRCVETGTRPAAQMRMG